MKQKKFYVIWNFSNISIWIYNSLYIEFVKYFCLKLYLDFHCDWKNPQLFENKIKVIFYVVLIPG